jgi:hypothetical protein
MLKKVNGNKKTYFDLDREIKRLDCLTFILWVVFIIYKFNG